MCQCPLTGYIHFYAKWNFRPYGKKTVSMPFNGLYPFLHGLHNGDHQCSYSVSMPFNGLHPFLHGDLYIRFSPDFRCQCPLTGCIHFYRDINTAMLYQKKVSMPFNGLHPFLPCHLGSPCL